VVEAMANRLPIVTTSIGCEGIDVTDGEHVLVADDAASFAARCLEAATEQRVRAGLIESAAKRFDDRYQWMSIRSTVARLADEAAGQALRSSSR
jgi:glycosyltransferase involved in cell wall biosynthesis